jgi:acyl carrier protein
MVVTLDKIIAMLAGFGVSADEVRSDTTLAELDVDSLAIVEFGMVAAKEFGVPIADDELTGEHTVQDVLDLLQQKLVSVP